MPPQPLSFFIPLPSEIQLDLPYYSQWESPDRIVEFIQNTALAIKDKLWSNSGAQSPDEYAHWAKDLCGMACLKMVIKHKLNQEIGVVTLGKLCAKYSGYQETDDEILGLYYEPFKRFVKQEFNLNSKVYRYLLFRHLLYQVSLGRYCIVSVHRTIRNPNTDPPTKGGHLVLVTGYNLKEQTISFHNPSGHLPITQCHHTISFTDFKRFFAQRGVVID